MVNLLDVLLMALSVVAVRKGHAKPTEPPAFRNNSKDSTAAQPGAQRLRLMNGGSHCSGRVELKYNDTWGMICDNNWDLAEAAVVCRQQGCGEAIQAPNASYFKKGTGPIHLGEVRCSGNESYLWDCPSEKNPDCGHRGEAGVICSDHQAWRLSGGLDACAGRVEVYYRDIWNTVCDSSWYQDEANVLCRSLGCSDKASVTRVPFDHTLPGKMYYECSGDEESLASCEWRYNKTTLCDQFRAAGVICNGSLGLENQTDTTVTETATEAATSVSHTPNPCWTRPESWDLKQSYQTLHTLCIVLGLFLFLAILSHIIIILLNRQRKNGILDCAISSASISAPVLVNHSVQVSTTGVNNDYREIPTSLPKGEAIPVKPSPISEDSDSDYERYDFSDKPPVALSTFYNSLRHRAPEEHLPPCNLDISAVHNRSEIKDAALKGHNPQEAAIAEDSESTSSGDSEWYENFQRPAYKEDHPGKEPLEGLTAFSRPLVNREAGPGNGSFNSSDYDDMWS
ncbi:T-cell differentiation antigen CD6 isoform X2 [Anolis carolinensis]|uniref:T-cell differentiation antigen CD6 isoform X2 n=1 Tax=Anolis carolinensis TaxID=28377 RepID=UPI002F2B3738